MGYSLLHLSLNESTGADDFRFDHMHRYMSTHLDILNIIQYLIYRYPCFHTARLLLQCGADIDTTTFEQNTPLHILVSNSDTYDESILQLLFDTNAHLDYANESGKTPIDVAINSNIKQLLKARMTLSLKCLCARLIHKNNVSFYGKIGKSLATFVERH